MILSQSISEEAFLSSIPRRRSNSNLPTPGHLRRRSLDNSLLRTPPVPRVPSAYATHPKRRPPTAPSAYEVLPRPPSSFPSSRKLQS